MARAPILHSLEHDNEEEEFLIAATDGSARAHQR